MPAELLVWMMASGFQGELLGSLFLIRGHATSMMAAAKKLKLKPSGLYGLQDKNK